MRIKIMIKIKIRRADLVVNPNPNQLNGTEGPLRVSQP